MASTELVGPLPKVVFRGGYALAGEKSYLHRVTVAVSEALPANTLDDRYPYCVDHHTACVCREAELAEDIAEYRGLYERAKQAAAEFLAGHRTFPTSSKGMLRWENGQQVIEYVPDEGSCCSCTGCQIARKAYLR